MSFQLPQPPPSSLSPLLLHPPSSATAAGYFIYSTVEGVSFQPRDVPTTPLSVELGDLIPGLQEVLTGMRPGEGWDGGLVGGGWWPAGRVRLAGWRRGWGGGWWGWLTG